MKIFRFKNKENAQEALIKMSGFEIAGRQIKVGLGVEKSTLNNDPTLIQNSPSINSNQNNNNNNINLNDKPGSNIEKARQSGLSLKDNDSNDFNNGTRESLMRKLMRDEDDLLTNDYSNGDNKLKLNLNDQNLQQHSKVISRCIVLKNMFDPAE